MLHDFAEFAVGDVVDAEPSEVEVADEADLLKEVVVADVHLVVGSVKVLLLVNIELVEVVSLVKVLVAVVGWSYNIPPPIDSACLLRLASSRSV